MLQYPKKHQNLETLKQDYNDIVSKHNTGIGLNHLEEMRTKTDMELIPVACKLYPLSLKHHKLVQEEIENLLQTRLIE